MLIYENGAITNQPTQDLKEFLRSIIGVYGGSIPYIQCLERDAFMVFTCDIGSTWNKLDFKQVKYSAPSFVELVHNLQTEKKYKLLGNIYEYGTSDEWSVIVMHIPNNDPLIRNLKISNFLHEPEE